MGLTSRLADWVVNTSFSDIPKEVIDKSKEIMLHATAAGLAATADKDVQIITQYVEEMGGRPECTIMGSGTRSSPVYTALVNSFMVDQLDFIGAVRRRANAADRAIFPTVMALGERIGLPGKEVLGAFATGCEACTKLGAAGDLDEVIMPRMASYGWNLSSVAGVIGAAAAAGKLLGLNREQMESAFGIAVSQASGVRASLGTPIKGVDQGQAAVNGIMAAMLAQKGLTSARNHIESAEGFFGCFRRDTSVDEDEFFRTLGNPYDIIDPGMFLKLYPCSSPTYNAIGATLQLVEEHHITPEQVRSVRAAVSEASVQTFTSPETGLQAKLSINYCIAVALVDGEPRIYHFTDEAINNTKVKGLMDKVTLEVSEQATMASRPCTVAITLADGREISHRSVYEKGHPLNPLKPEELEAKFEDCSGGILAPDQAQEAINQFLHLDELPDVAPLASLLGGAGS